MSKVVRFKWAEFYFICTMLSRRRLSARGKWEPLITQDNSNFILEEDFYMQTTISVAGGSIYKCYTGTKLPGTLECINSHNKKKTIKQQQCYLLQRKWIPLIAWFSFHSDEYYTTGLKWSKLCGSMETKGTADLSVTSHFTEPDLL